MANLGCTVKDQEYIVICNGVVLPPWYEYPIIFYDWVRYGEDLTPEYARWEVQRALNAHADTLAFCVVVGGYALWNSDVTPKYHHLGDMDLIGELSRSWREHGLHFVPWMSSPTSTRSITCV